MGLHVAETLHTPYAADYLSLGNNFHVINLIVPDDSKVETVGQLLEVARGTVEFLGFMRGTDFHPASKTEMRLTDGDRLMVLGKRDALRNLAGLL